MLLTSTQLRNELQITQPKLTAWIREGLPWEGTEKKKRFDEHKVARWLVENGKVKANRPVSPPRELGPICTTREEAANVLSVSPRTLATWCKMPGFPGRPGHRGRREGYYPITAIRQWHAETFPDSNMEAAGNPARSRKENAQAEMVELDLAERKGELVPLQDVINFYTRQMAQARAHLYDLADIVLSVLPTRKIKRDEQERIRERVDEVRDQVLETFVELLKGDTDPTDDEE